MGVSWWTCFNIIDSFITVHRIVSRKNNNKNETKHNKKMKTTETYWVLKWKVLYVVKSFNPPQNKTIKGTRIVQKDK